MRSSEGVIVSWSIRKSLRLLPGIRLNVSRSGPRLSIGIPGARASIGMNGKTRIYAGKGPVRFQKTIARSSIRTAVDGEGRLQSLLKRLFQGR